MYASATLARSKAVDRSERAEGRSSLCERIDQTMPVTAAGRTAALSLAFASNCAAIAARPGASDFVPAMSSVDDRGAARDANALQWFTQLDARESTLEGLLQELHGCDRHIWHAAVRHTARRMFSHENAAWELARMHHLCEFALSQPMFFADPVLVLDTLRDLIVSGTPALVEQMLEAGKLQGMPFQPQLSDPHSVGRALSPACGGALSDWDLNLLSDLAVVHYGTLPCREQVARAMVKSILLRGRCGERIKQAVALYLQGFADYRDWPRRRDTSTVPDAAEFYHDNVVYGDFKAFFDEVNGATSRYKALRSFFSWALTAHNLQSIDVVGALMVEEYKRSCASACVNEREAYPRDLRRLLANWRGGRTRWNRIAANRTGVPGSLKYDDDRYRRPGVAPTIVQVTACAMRYINQIIGCCNPVGPHVHNATRHAAPSGICQRDVPSSPPLIERLLRLGEWKKAQVAPIPLGAARNLARRTASSLDAASGSRASAKQDKIIRHNDATAFRWLQILECNRGVLDTTVGQLGGGNAHFVHAAVRHTVKRLVVDENSVKANARISALCDDAFWQIPFFDHAASVLDTAVALIGVGETVRLRRLLHVAELRGVDIVPHAIQLGYAYPAMQDERENCRVANTALLAALPHSHYGTLCDRGRVAWALLKERLLQGCNAEWISGGVSLYIEHYAQQHEWADLDQRSITPGSPLFFHEADVYGDYPSRFSEVNRMTVRYKLLRACFSWALEANNLATIHCVGSLLVEEGTRHVSNGGGFLTNAESDLRSLLLDWRDRRKHWNASLKKCPATHLTLKYQRDVYRRTSAAPKMAAVWDCALRYINQLAGPRAEAPTGSAGGPDRPRVYRRSSRSILARSSRRFVLRNE